jgi:hypothetical protein
MKSKLNDGMGLFTFKDIQEGYPDYIKIVKEIPDEIIYNFYLGFYPNLNRKFKSPFKQEKDPSFCFYIKDGKILYKCFSTGKFGDSTELVKQMYNLDYISSIKKICKDIKSLKINDTSSYKKLSSEDTKKSVIEVILRDFNKFDYDYWGQYYITPKILEKYNIKPCQEIWLNNKLYYVNQKNNPSYRFKIGTLYKIYCPLIKNKMGKWLSNCDLNNVQGLNHLNYSNNTLIITKSYRDVIVLNEFYNKSTIALNAEGNNIPDKMLEYFKSKFKNILCFYDNDETGIKYMIRNKELYQIEYFYLKPNLLDIGIKDISDYIKKYGIISIKNLKEDLIYSNKKIKKLI